MTTIRSLGVYDVRFPTSRQLDGSDAMNAAPDYSAAYVLLRTDDGRHGSGLTFTIGRGNEVVVAAVRSLARFVVGRTLAEISEDMGGFWRSLAGDSQLRWIGPEKGAIHLALVAIINSVWDLWAKAEGKPVWQMLADMEPERLVRCLDFRFVMDALTPAEAIAILRRGERGAACARPGCANAAIPPTRPVLVGSATQRKRCAGSPRRQLRRASPQSNRRSAATLQRTSGEQASA